MAERFDTSTDGESDSRTRGLRVLETVTALLAVLVMSAGAVAWRVVRAVDDQAVAEPDALVVFAGESARTRLALELVDAGRVPTVVFSHGVDDPLVADRCGQVVPIEVICAVPDPSNTRGEARMFADLAAERGWSSLLAVTGNYHHARARTLLDRCFDGDLAFVTVDWDDVRAGVYLRETMALWHATVLARDC
ncbi:MAG: YdcF family protein [Ilumatobacteraceae bacterium]